MYGDTEVIRALARSLRRQAHRLEDETAALLRRAETTTWTGLAADAMRASTQGGAAALRGTAELHLVAAHALEQHADEVDRRKALIAAVEQAVLQLVAEARHRLSGLSGLAGALGGAVGIHLPDPVDLLLDHFDPPPSGHRAWLSVDLPVAVPALDAAHALGVLS